MGRLLEYFLIGMAVYFVISRLFRKAEPVRRNTGGYHPNQQQRTYNYTSTNSSSNTSSSRTTVDQNPTPQKEDKGGEYIDYEEVK